jgi:hypothetical protein
MASEFNLERKIIIPWFERFNTVNKGILRIITLILFVNAYGWIAFVFKDLSAAVSILILVCLVTVAFSHLAIIFSFRILLWLYDGFISND